MHNLLKNMSNVFQQKTELVVYMVGEELADTLADNPYRYHILKLYLRLLDKVDSMPNVNNIPENIVFDKCGMKMNLAYIFSDLAKMHGSDCMNAYGYEFDEEYSYFDFCIDYVKQSFASSNIFDESYLNLLQKNIEYDIKLIPVRQLELANKQPEENDYDEDFDCFDTAAEKMNQEIIDHLAYEDGECPYSPYVEPEEYDAYRNGKNYIEYDDIMDDSYCKEDLITTDVDCDAYRYFGTDNCSTYSWDIANSMSSNYSKHNELMQLSLEQRMEKFEVNDYKEFCNLYPELISLEEAYELMQLDNITYSDYLKVFCYVHNLRNNHLEKEETTQNDFIPFDEEIPF